MRNVKGKREIKVGKEGGKEEERDSKRKGGIERERSSNMLLVPVYIFIKINYYSFKSFFRYSLVCAIFIL